MFHFECVLSPSNRGYVCLFTLLLPLLLYEPFFVQPPNTSPKNSTRQQYTVYPLARPPFSRYPRLSKPTSLQSSTPKTQKPSLKSPTFHRQNVHHKHTLLHPQARRKRPSAFCKKELEAQLKKLMPIYAFGCVGMFDDGDDAVVEDVSGEF